MIATKKEAIHEREDKEVFAAGVGAGTCGVDGVVCADCRDALDLEWMYVEGPWEHDPEMERLLVDPPPFPPVRSGELNRYRFDGYE